MIRSVLFAIMIFNFVLCTPKKESTETLGYYTEKHRPQYHFSPEAAWMNDPNGMVFYEGEYHLFYQYYPDDIKWGPMHWGHAVSKDMVHWSHLPIALYPDELGYIFSGSAVIDWNNTTGFGTGDHPPMVAIFTHHNIIDEKGGATDYQYQSLAYSTDKGRSWTKYDLNPVISNPGIKDFRDPKVIWHDQSKMWIMVLAVYDRVYFYNSPNLKEWNLTSEFGIPGDERLWECPDLFSLVDEETGIEKWILITSIQKDGPNGGTATSYFVGDFDGETFIGDHRQQYWLDYGTDNYALVTWSDVPESDGRRLALGWMSNWQYAQEVPTDKWRSAMTLPRSLSLYYSDDKFRLKSLPVRELLVLDKGKQSIPSQLYNENYVIPSDDNHGLFKLELSFAVPDKGMIEIRFSNSKDEFLSVGYDVAADDYFIDRTFSGISDFYSGFADYHTGEALYKKEQIDMTIYLDHSSIELFADQGKTVMTDIFFASEVYNKIELIAENNDVELLKGSITSLNSIWR